MVVSFRYFIILSVILTVNSCSTNYVFIKNYRNNPIQVKVDLYDPINDINYLSNKDSVIYYDDSLFNNLNVWKANKLNKYIFIEKSENSYSANIPGQTTSLLEPIRIIRIEKILLTYDDKLDTLNFLERKFSDDDSVDRKGFFHRTTIINIH